MCVGILHACMYVYHVHIWCWRRLEESLWVSGTGVNVVVSYHVGSGTKPGFSVWTASTLNHRANSPVQDIRILNVLFKIVQKMHANVFKQIDQQLWQDQNRKLLSISIIREGFSLKERKIRLRTFRLNVINLTNSPPRENSWAYAFRDQQSLSDLLGKIRAGN